MNQKLKEAEKEQVKYMNELKQIANSKLDEFSDELDKRFDKTKDELEDMAKKKKDQAIKGVTGWLNSKLSNPGKSSLTPMPTHNKYMMLMM